MAKDAKGHGSEKRGDNTVDMVYSSRFGVGGLGKGMYARTASGNQYKLNPIATGGIIPRVGSTLITGAHAQVPNLSAGPATAVAAAHGIDTSHLSAGGGMPANALDHETLRRIISNPEAAAAVSARGMSVPSSAAAESVLRSRYGYDDNEINQLKRQGK
jgi:hypothetical protein